MSVLQKILVGLLAAVILLVLLGFFLPSAAHVERTTLIESSPATVFSLINGFRGFHRWSPWAERDPETEYKFEGPDFGVGAKMSWSSQNPQVGEGFQRIVVSEPFSRVENQLDFGTQGTAMAFFQLLPVESGTQVTWGFDTDFGMNLVSRYLGLMFDKWIGSDYESGLANLKRLAEGLPKADWTDLEIELVEFEPMVVAFVATGSPWEAEAIGEAFGEAYGEVRRFLAAHDLESSGPPVGITTDSDGEMWRFDAGIPIAEMPELTIEPDSAVQIRRVPGGTSVRGVSLGPYTDLASSWEKVRAWVAVHGLESAGLPMEIYVSDPEETAAAELITHLHLPVRW